jgi:hypothetical protein
LDESYWGQITLEGVVDRFAACATCVGYCRDSDRQEYADAIQSDAVKLATLLQSMDVAWIEKLLALAQAHPDPWVKYFALVFVGKSDPSRSLEGLKALANGDLGLVSANAEIALFQLSR